MTDPSPPAEELTADDPTTARPRSGRRWWLAVVGALIVGLAGGAVAASAANDPTASPQYRTLQADLDTSRAETELATRRALTAEAASRKALADRSRASAEIAKRESDLVAQESRVTAREEAVQETEQAVADNSIGLGTWTVGVDVEAGSYRTSEAVARQCYWAILAGGSNGSDIIDNDIVQGGFPTVSLRDGQVFENNGCGTFVKQ